MLAAALLFSINTALLAKTVWRAYTTHDRQFFPLAATIFTATDSITLLTGFALFSMYFATLLLGKILFGRLRLIEEERVRELGWMTASESLLAMTVFRNQFDAGFVLLFAAVLAVKAVHWVAKARQEMMEQSIRLPDWYHLRMVGCLGFLLFVDVMGMVLSALSLHHHGPSMALLLITDFTILSVSVVSMSVKYGVAVYEQRQRTTNDTFEVSLFGLDRSTLLYYFDVLVDLCKLSVYLVFFMAIIVVYGLPLHLLRELYLTIAGFVKRCQDVIKYRQATENMNARYPDAKEEDLLRVHHLCIICREELVLLGENAGKRAKLLPCGHSFHFKCLRSWLERQQACPTCRANVITQNARSDTPTAPITPTAPNPAPITPTTLNTTTPNNTTHNTNDMQESIESLKRQMEELQRNMTETADLIRSMSGSSASASTGSVSSVRDITTGSVGIGNGTPSASTGNMVRQSNFHEDSNDDEM